MNKNIKGKVLKFGDNINTDIISPPQFMELSIQEAAPYAMSAVSPDFHQKVKDSPIMVAGNNFGSGSSRETSPLTLKYLGVTAIVAKFFARIFYRNAINVGIPVIECPDADRISESDEIEIDLKEGIIINITQNETYACSKIPDHILEIIQQGGMVNMLKNELGISQISDLEKSTAHGATQAIPLALEGLVVIDLSRVLAGPYCTMMLADMGAQVIKVEIPGAGDDSRGFPPFIDGESAYFKNMNRNKKGVTLDLKKEEGKEVFLDLIKKADILVENYRPGTMEKLGLGWETLKQVNPRLVYGSVSGFGHYGQYTQRAGYDIIGQAMSGIMSVTGWPGGEPTRTGGPISDTMSGLSLAVGILAAVIGRNQTGEGQKVDIALVDTLVSSMQIINQIYLAGGRLPERIGNRYESTYPYDTFETQDGESIVIGCANNKFWKILCNLMGREELTDHPDMKENKARVQNHAMIKPIVNAWTKTLPSKELVEMLLEKGVPAAPIYNIAQVAADPHIAEDREMFIEAEYPRVGKIKVTGSHLKMSETKTGFRFPSPDLGQHNDEVYSELLGYTSERVKELSERGII